VGVGQKAAIEAHLSLLWDDVDLVAAAHHRETDRIVQERPGGPLGGDLAYGRPPAEPTDHLLDRRAETVLRILAQDPEDRLCPPVEEMVRRLGGGAAVREIAAQRATRPLLHDTVSLTMMSGGYKINIIPEQAEMSFDCRLLPDTDERAFISNLAQTINDPGVELEVTWP